MAFRRVPGSLITAAALAFTAVAPVCCVHAQVFVVGEKTATADVATDFKPTRVELSSKPLNELGRRELIRDLEAEQGFAHRSLPLGQTLMLMANGNMAPSGEAYKELIYKKGQSAAPGDRVVISSIAFSKDRILLDVNGGPYLKHRILRHIQLNGTAMAVDNGEQVTGFRIALVFEGGIPDVSAPEVKALLDPVIDFGVKNSREAYAQTLPPFLKEAIDHHDVLVGMNRRMVIASAGAPESKVRELEPGSDSAHYEEWIYGKVPQTVRFVRIENDRVTQVRIASLGQAIVVKNENELDGYLDPMDTHAVAMGDRAGGADDESRPAGGPPTLRKPGDAEPPNSAQRVQYPVPHKEKPLPAAPGSPADSSSNSSLPGGPSTNSQGLPSLGPPMDPRIGTQGKGTGVPANRVH